MEIRGSPMGVSNENLGVFLNLNLNHVETQTLKTLKKNKQFKKKNYNFYAYIHLKNVYYM